jgi:hypothetical protein
MAANTFPARVEDLTNEWLTQVLHTSGVPEAVEVTGFSVGPVKDPGQTSEVVQIALEYNGIHPEAPETLIGKFPATFEQARQMAQGLDTYLKEVEFFRCIAPSAGDLVPKCFASEINRENHDFVVLLEDLSDLKLGEIFLSRPEDSRFMLEKIAPFHAYWWEHPDLETFDWIPQPGKESGKAWFDKLKLVYTAILPMIKGQYQGYMSDSAWSVLEKWLEVWDEMLEYAPGPYTLCHGDYHYLQGFFPTEKNNRFSIIDWQVLCINSAGMDVSRPLLIDPEDRRACEESAVEDYHNLLLKHGVKDYSLDQLWEDIRLQSLWTPYIYLLAIAQTDNAIFQAYAEARGKDPYEALLTWPGSALDDWKVGEAIDRYLERARAAKA